MDEQELRSFGRADQTARPFAPAFAGRGFVGGRGARREEREEERRREEGGDRGGGAADRDLPRAPQTGRTEIRRSRESIFAALTVPPAPSSSPSSISVARTSPAM